MRSRYSVKLMLGTDSCHDRAPNCPGAVRPATHCWTGKQRCEEQVLRIRAKPKIVISSSSTAVYWFSMPS